MDLSLHTILLISATFCVFVEEGKSLPLSSCYTVVKDANLCARHRHGMHWINLLSVNVSMYDSKTAKVISDEQKSFILLAMRNNAQILRAALFIFLITHIGDNTIM